jgi:hypothetical protein
MFGGKPASVSEFDRGEAYRIEQRPSFSIGDAQPVGLSYPHFVTQQLRGFHECNAGVVTRIEPVDGIDNECKFHRNRALSLHCPIINQMALLDRAVKLAAEADEPLEMNFVRKHALEQAEEMGVSVRQAATRIFSNASGSYASNVNLAVENRL